MKTVSKSEIVRKAGKPSGSKFGQPCGPTGPCTICKSTKRSTLLKVHTETLLKK